MKIIKAGVSLVLASSLLLSTSAISAKTYVTTCGFNPTQIFDPVERAYTSSQGYQQCPMYIYVNGVRYNHIYTLHDGQWVNP
ncbi:hypothetical protein [Thalassomonas actiniarum]|uniref:Uncharacterized protein n=1 Tax=Thalassomonas actiniarum TaxID=485447 RepID=A0AAF0C5K7_9GAMM|nr:hypothetical protein [Thalassomonas actiniarum]WDE01663.1 hypothetical protein SG35_014160 [Thalassomonas actiniarum]